MRAVWSFTVCGVLGCAPTSSTTEYARLADGDGDGGGGAASADASNGTNDARRDVDAGAPTADGGRLAVMSPTPNTRPATSSQAFCHFRRPARCKSM